MRSLFVSVILLLSAQLLARNDPTTVSELFLSPQFIEIIEDPDTIEACMLKIKDPMRKYIFWGPKDLTKRKYVEGDFVSVPDEIASNLKKNLLSEESYRWGIRVGCVPIFQSRLRFNRGDEEVEIDFCFLCSIMNIRRKEEYVSGSVFDMDRTGFLDQMIALFPEEEKFIKVKEFRENKTDY